MHLYDTIFLTIGHNTEHDEPRLASLVSNYVMATLLPPNTPQKHASTQTLAAYEDLHAFVNIFSRIRVVELKRKS